MKKASIILDEKINAYYLRTEEEKEKALIDFITKIIVKTTLEEYYDQTELDSKCE